MLSEVSCQKSRKERGSAKSLSLRQREVEQMEFEKLFAKQEAEQQLRDQKTQIEMEPAEIELRQGQEKLSLQQQQRQQQH